MSGPSPPLVRAQIAMPMHTAAATALVAHESPGREAATPSSPAKLEITLSLEGRAPAASKSSHSLTALLSPALRPSSSASSLRELGKQCPASPSLQRSSSKDCFMSSVQLEASRAPRSELLAYGRFHAMVINPFSAGRCIRAVTGRVLSLPSSYLHDADAFPASGRSPYDTTPMSLFAYYRPSLSSSNSVMRALSTLLLLTEVIDARNTDEAEVSSLPSRGLLLKSGVARSSLLVDERVLGYLAARGAPAAPASGSSTEDLQVKVVRRFEYKFFHIQRFDSCASHVLILHFATVTRTGEPVRDAAVREVLHVVEVCEPGWGCSVAQACALGVLLAVGSALSRKAAA